MSQFAAWRMGDQEDAGRLHEVGGVAQILGKPRWLECKGRVLGKSAAQRKLEVCEGTCVPTV